MSKMKPSCLADEKTPKVRRLITALAFTMREPPAPATTGAKAAIGHRSMLKSRAPLPIKYRMMLQKDEDPKKEGDSAKLDDRIARGLVKTVNEVVDEYLETQIAGLKPFALEQVKYWLTRYVRKKIGGWPIEKVDQNTILKSCELRSLWIAQNPTGKGLQNHLSRIFDLAIEAG